MCPSMRNSPLFALLVLFGLGSMGLLGCGATCDRREDSGPRRYEGGTTANDVYQSSPWNGPYLDFPAGRSYLLMHGLGGTPITVVSYLSFDAHPIPADGEERQDRNSNTAPCAGNQCILEGVTSEHIEIRNDTCSDGYLRVVASDPEL
jgi:hypothetical protein